jgi:FkbM family methyltransferase
MKYFIDCGTHLFQGLQMFDKIYNFDNNWTIYSFEANPITFQESIKYKPNKFKNLIHENKAVSTQNSRIKINCDIRNDNGMGQGSNILKNPPNMDITYGGIFSYVEKEVDSFDFIEFIKTLKNIELLIVKFGIEGEEFNILEKLISSDSYKIVNKYYIEFHERFFINQLSEYQELKNKYIKYIKENGCQLEEWI